MEDMRIFEEVEVECNDCEAYWLNQCDGANHHATKCVSYIATKRVDIPVKIQTLERKVNSLNNYLLAFSIALIAEIIIMFILR
jgi:hypothetical protein